jgi:hypothetical protein
MGASRILRSFSSVNHRLALAKPIRLALKKITRNSLFRFIKGMYIEHRVLEKVDEGIITFSGAFPMVWVWLNQRLT